MKLTEGLRQRFREKRRDFGERRPSQEVFAQLTSLQGRDLLQAEPVRQVVEYAKNWQPFLSNTSSEVKPSDPLRIDPLTNAFELPHVFISPSTRETTSAAFWGNAQFNWDTYFVNKALTLSQDPQLIEFAKGQVENLLYMFDKLGYIPNASKLSIANRTQIPFLTGMILDVYKATGDKEWLAQTAEIAKKEYATWMMTQEELQTLGLSRPSHRNSSDSLLIHPAGRDILTEHYPAAANTGFDDSSQWARRAFEYSPVSLNCAMFKYETEFAWIADILGDPIEKGKWETAAHKRREEMNLAFWDEEKGMYFDGMYDRDTKQWVRDTNYYGLTSFMPLWVGLATTEQAERQAQQLHRFESPYGLMVGSEENRISPKIISKFNKNEAFKDPKMRRYRYSMLDLLKPQQWEFPHIWGPVSYFAIDGLIKYGKNEAAQRALESSLRGLAGFYAERKTLPEKLNGKTGMNGESYNYPDQEGYGWTNAFVLIAANRLQALQDVYATIAS